MLNYWQRLEYVDSFPILQLAYKHSKKLYINIMSKKKISKEYVVKSLWKHFLALWKEKMNNCSDGKLQTYTKVKTSFGCEKIFEID